MRYLAGILAVAGVWVSCAPQLAAQVLPVTGASATPQTVIGTTVLNPSQSHISGRVVTPGGDPIANTMVRARNLISGQVGGSTSTASSGQFAINVNPGSYLLEVVDAGGQIIGTSSFISAAAGGAVTTTTVTATTGALSAVTTTTAGLISTLGASAARSVTYAAAAAGVAGVVTPAETITASPSR
jgi:hypothetical protein